MTVQATQDVDLQRKAAEAEDDQANIEWARAAWRDMRRFSTGGTYVNFLTEEEGAEVTLSA